MQKDFAFVYGTLKNMERLYDNVRKVGRAVTTETYVLFDGGYPLAITPEDPEARELTNAHARIVGEVYEVDPITLDALDDYEGTSPDNDDKSFYYRKVVTVRLDDGVEVPAWMYLGAQAKQSIPHRSVIIPNDLGEVSWR